MHFFSGKKNTTRRFRMFFSNIKKPKKHINSFQWSQTFRVYIYIHPYIIYVYVKKICTSLETVHFHFKCVFPHFLLRTLLGWKMLKVHLIRNIAFVRKHRLFCPTGTHVDLTLLFHSWLHICKDIYILVTIYIYIYLCIGTCKFKKCFHIIYIYMHL